MMMECPRPAACPSDAFKLADAVLVAALGPAPECRGAPLCHSAANNLELGPRTRPGMYVSVILMNPKQNACLYWNQ